MSSVNPRFILCVLMLSICKLVTAQTGDIIVDGSGVVVGRNITHPNGNVFDQVLLTGLYIKLQAKPGQITRVSFMDENEDIVQVEFSGAGTFEINLEPSTYLPPMLPPRYNQSIEYVTGKASIVIEGADSSTFFSVFTVGSINAVNQALFPEDQAYDAIADIKLVEVINSTGFGGMQFANVRFSGSTGKVGVDARDVPIAVRLTVFAINASGSATPYLLFGEGSFTVPASNSGLRITGGDLYQSNVAKIVAISEAENLIFQSNVRSDGRTLPAQRMQGSFNFIDRQSFIPQNFNNTGYTFNYGEYFDYEDYSEDIYFTGNPRLGNFEGFASEFLETGELLTLIVFGSYRGKADFNDPNKLHLTFNIIDIKFWLDGNLVFSGSLKDFLDLITDVLGKRLSSIYAVLLRDVKIEMDFRTSTSGTFKEIPNLGSEFELDPSYGTFEEIK